jgi:hypothetical protein
LFFLLSIAGPALFAGQTVQLKSGVTKIVNSYLVGSTYRIEPYAKTPATVFQCFPPRVTRPHSSLCATIPHSYRSCVLSISAP